MSVKIMSRVWEQSPQKDSRLLLTLALADNANDDGICWPSTDYLRDKIRMSKRQTQRLLDKLEETAEIWVARPDHNGPNATNHYVVLSGMTDEQILNALEDLGIGKSGDKKKADIPGSGDILASLKQQRVTFCDVSGDIPDLENLPDFSVIGKRQEVRRKRTTVNRTVSNKEPSSDSAKPNVPKKKSEPKEKSSRRPGADLTDAMFKATPEEIRPPKPEYMKHYRKAEDLFGVGCTPEQVKEYVEWKYATDNWMWTGSNGTPVIITMGMVANNIKACSGAVKQWISEGRPNFTGRAKETAKVEEVEKPFTIEDDPNNPKNWPIPAKDLAAAYQTYKKQLEQIHGITNYEPPELHQPGGENQIPSSSGTNGTQIPPRQQQYLSAMFEHGGRGNKST